MDLLSRAAQRLGPQVALRHGGQTLSFSDWDRAARPRDAFGTQRVVALLARREPCFAVALFGLRRLGKVVPLVSPDDPQARVDALLASVGAQILLDPRDWKPGDEPSVASGTEPGFIVFTSGSTGGPKAVVHSEETLACSARQSNRNMPFHASHAWALTLSPHHVGGLSILFRALEGGGCVVFPAGGPGHPVVSRPDVTHASFVAPQLAALLEGPNVDAKGILVGGGPTSHAVLLQALMRGLPVLSTYGCTEMGSQITTVRPPASAEDLATAGWPLESCEVRIDPKGQILARGPSMALGTWHDGRIIPVCDAEGWYATGDLGLIDEEGRLVVRGRMDRAFVSGGENVVPEEIERALLGLVGVTEAVVVDVPHPRWGRRPVAFVRGPGQSAALRTMLRSLLPGFAIPDWIAPLPPETPGWPGKRNRAWLSDYALRI